MSFEQSLYEGQLVRLGPINQEKDPAIESKWTHDSEYLRLIGAWPSWPVSPERMKKKYEAIEKSVEEDKNVFCFSVRLRSDDGEKNDRLLGFAYFTWVDWSNGTVHMRLTIGDPADRRKGYGSDALSLLLRFAFDELNMHRVSVDDISGHNTAALAFFEKYGFVEEVRRRKAVQLDGQLWDAISLGLLREEWAAVLKIQS